MFVHNQFQFPAALLLVFAFMPGCGNKNDLVQVKGRVTFDGQAPPKSGRLYFGSPLDAPTKARPAYAAFDDAGNFEVTSLKPGDGLLPGKYLVTVECVKSDPPPVPGGLESVTYVDLEFKGQTIEIKGDGSDGNLQIDVPLKKVGQQAGENSKSKGTAGKAKVK